MSWGTLLTNGSFENSPVNIPGSPGFITVGSPNTWVLPGWTVAFGNIDYIGPYWQAAHGSRSLDLNGFNSQGTIYQTFPSTPGQRYLVTFALAGNPDLQPRWANIRVWVHDGLNTFDSADFNYWVSGQTRSSMGWRYVNWTFTAQSVFTTLGFTSLDNSAEDYWAPHGYSFGPALDDVSVIPIPIPEPATLALVGLGLIGLGFLRRKS
ncbi:MAG: choice-of-anchor C family protein [Bryobacterales bacterium]|nr:choice-of-anchor C family protein [Bryobacterales bacterium]